VSKANQEQQRNYHHGNLKEALTHGFLELLESVPIDKLSLRKLATHVGVAPTAVYNHFDNKGELLATIKVHCLNHFGDYLDEQILDITDPAKRINQLGKAYFRYSTDYSTYFDFIMSDNVPDEYTTEELLNASMRAEAAVRKAAISLLESNNIPVTQYNEGLGSFACWAVAHGITTLSAKRVNQAACVAGRWPPEFMLNDKESVNACFDAMTDVMVAGILNAAKKDDA
jgi:AcrR family transcriptional regulator